MKVGLRAKLLLPILFGYVLMAMAVHFVWAPLYLQRQQQVLEETQHRLLTNLEPSLRHHFTATDLDALRAALRYHHALNAPLWRQLVVYDQTNTRLYPPEPPLSLKDDAVLRHEHIIQDEEGIVLHLELSIDQGTIHSHIRAQIFQLEMLALGVFGFLSLVALWVQDMLVRRPLRRIKAAATEFAQGNFAAPLPRMGDDEIGALSTALDKMRTHILRAQLDLHRSEERQRAISSLTSDCAYALMRRPDNQWQYEWSSGAFAQITGFNDGAELAAHGDWLSLVHADDSALAQAQWQALQDGEEAVSEYRIITRDGAQRWIRHYARPLLKWKQTVGIYGAVQDISLQKQHEAHLEQARQQAEIANHAKSAFLANVSHELRTPLNIILGYTQLFLNDSEFPHQRDINAIHRSGTYLLTLINDILDLSKIETGRFELFPQACDAHALFMGLAEMFEIQAQDKSLAFSYITTLLPKWLNLDEKRLRQIVMNLLSNAVKFTHQGEVILDTRYGDDCLHVSVQDTGVGIAAADMAHIFAPFQQIGEVLHKNDGAGLGLALTYKLVHLMDGKIEVSSTPGQGSAFSLTLPAPLLETGAPAHAEVMDIPALKGYRRLEGKGAYRILIADDLSDNRKLLRRLLEPLGFAVKEARDGQECLDIAPHWRPDVILMDLRMPIMDGLAATRTLRKLPTFAQTPIIAISAKVFPEEQAQIIAAGCDLYFPKPLDMRELLLALQSFLDLEWIKLARASAAPVQTLPLQERECLLKHVHQGDLSGLQKELKRLMQSPDHPPLLSELSRAAQACDMRRVRQLLISAYSNNETESAVGKTVQT
jgi:PAS domain S-box-containing protein